MLAYVGVCWPILRATWAHLVAMFASCWPMLSQKIRKMRAAKNAVKRRIFGWSAAYLGAMLAHLGAMLAHLEGNVGPSWGYVGPSWGYVGPSWGYVGPSWGLCWPMLGLCWPILRPMLAHVDPSSTTRSEKMPKTGRAQNTVKRGTFWRPGVSPAGGAAPLSYGEERNAFGYATARGPLAGFKRLRATAGQGPNYVGPFCGYVGLCWPMLAYLAGNVGPSCSYVGLCWPHVDAC